MECIQDWDLLDKSDWGDGPWQMEPDKIQWQDNATGLPCLVVRNHYGVWCGYVGVSKTHPSYEKNYDDVHVNVHGGLTFSAKCHPDGKICHLVSEGEDDNVWWLGFDCGHGCDVSPALRSYYKKKGFPLTPFDRDPLDQDEVYRDLAYVKGQVEQLAAQLTALPFSDDPLIPNAAA